MKFLEEIKCTELNKKETTKYQSMWDAGKVVLRGKVITQNIYVEKRTNLNTNSRNQKTKSKINAKQEKSRIIKTRAEINYIKNHKIIIEKNNETKVLSLKIK